DLARRVAFDVPRQLLQLYPEQPASLGCARGIDRQRLADDDRCLGRQETAFRLVDGTRDAVEPRRDVNDRGARETFIANPAWRFRQRVVDLHFGATEPESLPRLGDVAA